MRWLRLTPATREALIALGLTVAVELELILSDRGTPARAVAALLITVPLVFRLRFPVAVLALVVAGTVVGASHGANPVTGPIFPAVAVLLALYAVGSQATGARLAAGGIVSFVGLLAASLVASRDVGGALLTAIRRDLVSRQGRTPWRVYAVARGEPARSLNWSSSDRDLEHGGPFAAYSVWRVVMARSSSSRVSAAFAKRSVPTS
ncbi:MAG TPA: hypothetical protein VLP43_02170 [Solirubrobacteraceae bacterium]|nr:hypothetical protein [Solirubrobacteraceae bacterium]